MFGLFDGDTLAEQFRVATDPAHTGDELAVLLRAFVRAGDEVLPPVLGELDRTPEQLRRPRHQHLFRPRVDDLDPEAATAFLKIRQKIVQEMQAETKKIGLPANPALRIAN